MIAHVVLFKLKSIESPELKKELMDGFKSRLLSLKNIIPELKFIEVGQNYSIESNSFDVSLISHFESLADLEIYSTHPDHVAVSAFIKPYVDQRAAVDYEF